MLELTNEDFRKLGHLHYDYENDFKDFYEYKDIIPKFRAYEEEILDALAWYKKKSRFYEMKQEYQHIITKKNLEIYHLKKKMYLYMDKADELDQFKSIPRVVMTNNESTELLRENKNLKEGLQAHRDELYKSQCLYKGLQLDFEDLAKEDCEIRQKAIKDIKRLKEELNHETYRYDTVTLENINLKQRLEKFGQYGKKGYVITKEAWESYNNLKQKLKKIEELYKTEFNAVRMYKKLKQILDEDKE